VSATGVTALSGGAAAAASREPPEHVTITDDPAAIRPWQPRLSWSMYPSESQEPLGCYAVRASSPEHDTDCIVAWHSYAQQHGVTGEDSHPGDHEPVYVFFDPSTGDVTEVVYSVFHWRAGSSLPGGVRLVDTDSGGQQPVLEVVTPWHHHLPVVSGADTSGRTFELRSLSEHLDAWLINGLDDPLRPDQPYNPWRMCEAANWWRDGYLPFWETWVVSLRVDLGLGNVPSKDRTGWSE
jgi:hypothetical protein